MSRSLLLLALLAGSAHAIPVQINLAGENNDGRHIALEFTVETQSGAHRYFSSPCGTDISLPCADGYSIGDGVVVFFEFANVTMTNLSLFLDGTRIWDVPSSNGFSFGGAYVGTYFSYMALEAGSNTLVDGFLDIPGGIATEEVAQSSDPFLFFLQRGLDYFSLFDGVVNGHKIRAFLPSHTLVAVPEPATLVLFVIGLALLLSRQLHRMPSVLAHSRDAVRT